jgi:hypothetical protein
MSNLKSVITVGMANEGEMNINIDVIRGWEPKKISYIGTSVFFEVDGSFVSMKRVEFTEIFGIKYL